MSEDSPMRERTVKQQAVLWLLVSRGPLRPKDVLYEHHRHDVTLPPTLAKNLPETVGSARDRLEQLVRRGEARRRSGSPAFYDAVSTR